VWNQRSGVQCRAGVGARQGSQHLEEDYNKDDEQCHDEVSRSLRGSQSGEKTTVLHLEHYCYYGKH